VIRHDQSLGNVIDSLLPLNCFYNHEPDAKGLCHSDKCMFNQDLEIRKKIQESGCTFYKNNPEVQGMILEKT
jgi:hypothetical protein